MVGPGYDYEITNTEILLQLEVKDGQLVLPTGGKFSLLVLADETEINPLVLKKLEALIDDGAIILGSQPEAVIALPDRTADLATIIPRLWDQSTDRHVIADQTPVTVLHTLGVGPDVDYVDRALYPIDFVHYQKDALDFYFLRNTADRWVSREIGFRQQQKIPEIWDAVSGEIVPVSVYTQTDSHLRMPISLPPFGALFVVFRPGTQNPIWSEIGMGQSHPPRLRHTNEGIMVMEDGRLTLRQNGRDVVINHNLKHQPLTGAWEVFFDETGGAPRRAIFPQLDSWTDADTEGIKYYSGTARYEKTFQYGIHDHAVSDARVYLDLGDLSKVGEVWLNGKTLGVAWAKPYRFDVTDVLVPGSNELKVEVANVWSNRMKGDRHTEGKDYTFSNIPETVIDGLNRTRVAWKDVPLIKSGLFGPVQLITVVPVTKKAGNR